MLTSPHSDLNLTSKIEVKSSSLLWIGLTEKAKLYCLHSHYDSHPLKELKENIDLTPFPKIFYEIE